jgi:chromosome segregation ATPase
MSTKKKGDLTSEFVDLLLDDPEVTKKTQVPGLVKKGTAINQTGTKSKEATAISPFRPGDEVSQMIDPSTSTSFEENISKSEHLRIAQDKILELEDETERLRVENEQLSANSAALKHESEELTGKLVLLEKRQRDLQESYNDEKNLLRASLTAKDKEILNLRMKVQELESRLLGDLKKIRVRERELENRLELAKMEGAAVIRSKDEVILDLKRQSDQLAQEMESFKMKAQGLNQQIEMSEDRMRRAVKALRLALSMLDGEEGMVVPLRKAE